MKKDKRTLLFINEGEKRRTFEGLEYLITSGYTQKVCEVLGQFGVPINQATVADSMRIERKEELKKISGALCERVCTYKNVADIEAHFLQVFESEKHKLVTSAVEGFRNDLEEKKNDLLKQLYQINNKVDITVRFFIPILAECFTIQDNSVKLDRDKADSILSEMYGVYAEDDKAVKLWKKHRELAGLLTDFVKCFNGDADYIGSLFVIDATGKVIPTNVNYNRYSKYL